MNTVANNPNATLALSSTGVGVVMLYILGLFGITMPADVAVVISGVFTSFILFIGKNGVKGFLKMVWRGVTPSP